MKLIYLYQYFKFPHEIGGTRSYDLAQEFLAKGIKVEVVTTTSEDQFKTGLRWKSFEEDGLLVHCIYLPYSNEFSYFKRALIFFQFLWFSTFKLLSLKGDMVLATSTPLTIGIPSLVKKWVHQTPFIFETRDVWPEAVIAIGAVQNKVVQKLLYSLEKLIYKNAAAIVPLSIDMKMSIVNRYPNLSIKPIEVIENIAAIKRFQKGFDKNRSILKEILGFSPRFAVLYAGTFGKVNGIEYVIELAEEIVLIDPTIVFILVGGGAEKEKVRKLAQEKGVYQKNVFILNAVAKRDLPQLYYEANMGSSFVIDIKELWANSANKFFDSLAAGRPILVNYEGWQKKVIEDNNLGYVLPVQITDRVVQEFVAYTKNERIQTIQKQNALKKAIYAYSLEVAAEKYTRIFTRINNVQKIPQTVS